MIRPILGLSIREFSDETGINRGELSKIERGLSCPTPGQANAILSAWQRFRDPA
jgi:transcriptional regulator with XRE-family HTH domain